MRQAGQQGDTFEPARRPSPRAGSPLSWIELDPDGAGLHVEDFPSMRLAAVSAALHRKVTRHYLRGSGLSLPEWRMLTLLEAHAPVSARRVSLFSGMDKGQISRSLGRLVERGLAARTGNGRQDHDLTAAGRALFASIMPVARRSQAHLLRQLTLSERKMLGSALAKLAILADRFPETGAGNHAPGRLAGAGDGGAAEDRAR